MKWVLYKDLPLRPLYANGLGFQRPRQDDPRPLWIFSSELQATNLRRTLRHDAGGFVHVGKHLFIKTRMKHEWEDTQCKPLAK